MRRLWVVTLFGGCQLAFSADPTADAPSAGEAITLDPELPSQVFADGGPVAFAVNVVRSKGQRDVYYRLECNAGGFVETNSMKLESMTAMSRVVHAWTPPTGVGTVTCGITASFDPLLAEPATAQVKTTVVDHEGAFDLSPTTPLNPPNNVIAVGFVPTVTAEIIELGAHVTSAGKVQLGLYAQRTTSPGLFDLLTQTPQVAATGTVNEPVTHVTVTSGVLHYIVLQGEQAVTIPGRTLGTTPPCQTFANQFPNLDGTIALGMSVASQFEVFGTIAPIE